MDPIGHSSDSTPPRDSSAPIAKWLPQFVDSTPLPCLLADHHGKVVFINELASELFGYASGELDGQLLEILMPERYRERHGELQSDFFLGLQSINGAGRVLPGLRKDGTEFPVEIGLSSISTVSGVYALCSLVDLTEREQAAEALADTKALYESLVETLPLNILRKDHKGRFVFANLKACEFIGTTREELKRKTDFDLFPRELAEKYRADDERVMVEGIVLEDVEEHRTPEGGTIYVHILKSPVRDARGRTVGVQVAFWDVSDRKKAELAVRRSDARFRRLRESDIIGIIVASLDGRVLEANEEFLRIVGYVPEDLESGLLRWDTITPAEFRETDEDAIRRLRTTGRASAWEKEYIRKDGSRVPVVVGVTMLEEGRDDCLCYVLDASRQKQTEAELEAARDAADMANHAKSAFLANMSHEIRTPMNAIIGMTDLVLDSRLNSEQRDYLSMVLDSAESLLELINDLLDFSKIEAGKLELETIDFALHDCISGAAKALAVQAHSRGLELVCRIDPNVPLRVLGDPTRLRQIVNNLVSNAVKFTESGEVVVHASVVSTAGNTMTLHIGVTDTGIGIPEEQQNFVFDAFEQLDKSMARKYGGTGLGLAISERLARIMNGRLWFDSKSGQGSQFHLEVPFQVESNRTDDEAWQLPSQWRNATALVIDDNESSRDAIVAMLKSWSIEAVAVADIAAARTILAERGTQRNPFNVLFVDAQLQDAGVDDISAMIAEVNGVGPDAVIYLLQPGERADQSPSVLPGGRDATVMKPINPSELFDTLVAVLCGESLENLPESPPPAKTATGSLKILLVEDSLYNQKLAQAVLAKLGHLVTVAENGVQAVEKTRKQQYDLVLMDVQMPEMDGLEATRRIRDRERGGERHVPIIAMTAQAMKGDRERCVAAGMDDYLPKPVRPAELRAKIESVATGRQSAGTSPAMSSPSPAPQSNVDENKVSVVDWSVARKYVGGDEDILQIAAEAFLEECPKLLATLREGIKKGDPDSIRIAAHTLKNAMRTWGEDTAYSLGAQLEQVAQCADANLEPAVGLAAEFEQRVTAVQDEVERFVQ